MTALGLRRTTLAIYALAVLAGLALLLEAGKPIHLHHGDAPGFYNGECLLATLAAFHGLATLPLLPASVSTALVIGSAAFHPSAPVVRLLVRHTDPRAPPFA